MIVPVWSSASILSMATIHIVSSCDPSEAIGAFLRVLRVRAERTLILCWTSKVPKTMIYIPFMLG